MMFDFSLEIYKRLLKSFMSNKYAIMSYEKFICEKTNSNKMSAKQSLDYSNWVRQEIAKLLSPNRGKTLKPRSEKPNSIWKRILFMRLDKVITHPAQWGWRKDATQKTGL
jgi:hypothetical protein